MASTSPLLLGAFVCCARQVTAMQMNQNTSDTAAAGRSLRLPPLQSSQQPATWFATAVGGSAPELPSVRLVAVGTLMAAFGTIVAGLVFRPDTSQTYARGSVERPSAAPTRRLSPLRILALTALSFGYGFSMALQGLVLTAQDAKRLCPGSSSLALGALMVMCGVAQIVGPGAGHWSDGWRSRLGRRRPLILIAACGLTCLTLALWLCSSLQLRLSYFAVFLAQQVAWNVLSSTQVGLVPDLVVSEQRGFAGGASAANTLAGALVAFLAVIAFGAWDYHVHYGFIVVVVLVTSSIVCFAAQEESSLNRRIALRDQESLWARIMEVYSLDIEKYPDFALLLVTKTLYCTSAIVKTFLFYFTEDTFRLPDESEAQSLTARVALVTEMSAAAMALTAMIVLDGSKGCNDVEVAGRLTSWSTKTRSIMAIGAGQLWMGLLWLGPIWVGWNVQKHFPDGGRASADAWSGFMVRSTAVWGAGQGLYLAGDQALSFALVPDQDQAARYLSLNSVCACIGCCIGGAACGGLLTVFGAAPLPGQAYAFEGYVVIFIFASILHAIISLLAMYMRSREKRSKQLA